MASSDIKVHALVLPYPAQGHINPMLQFCKRLVSKGVKATFVNTVFLSKSLHTHPKNSINFETISDGCDECGYTKAEGPGVYLEKFRLAGSRTLADLIKKLQGNGQPVDVVIYDSFLPWALDVAKQFGLVTAAFFTQTCAVNSFYYHVYNGLVPVPLSDSPISLKPVPVWSDQPTNAKLLEEVWGVGVRANADENGIVRKETLVSCLKEIMEGEKGKEIN